MIGSKLERTKKFDLQIRRLLKKNPSLKGRVRKTFRLLLIDRNHPSLRLHKVHDVFSVSVDMKTRILLYFEGEKIFLLEIGSHDQVYD